MSEDAKRARFIKAEKAKREPQTRKRSVNNGDSDWDDENEEGLEGLDSETLKRMSDTINLDLFEGHDDPSERYKLDALWKITASMPGPVCEPLNDDEVMELDNKKSAAEMKTALHSILKNYKAGECLFAFYLVLNT
jgi:hypothetical protein